MILHSFLSAVENSLLNSHSCTHTLWLADRKSYVIATWKRIMGTTVSSILWCNRELGWRKWSGLIIRLYPTLIFTVSDRMVEDKRCWGWTVKTANISSIKYLIIFLMMYQNLHSIPLIWQIFPNNKLYDSWLWHVYINAKFLDWLWNYLLLERVPIHMDW